MSVHKIYLYLNFTITRNVTSLFFLFSYYKRSKENEEKLYFSEVEDEERDGDLPSDNEFQQLDTVVDHIIRIQEKKDGDIPCSLACVNCLQELTDMQVLTARRLCQSPVASPAAVSWVGTAGEFPTIQEKRDGDIACSLAYVNCLLELATT